jgi:hypothetical protein
VLWLQTRRTLPVALSIKPVLQSSPGATGLTTFMLQVARVKLAPDITPGVQTKLMICSPLSYLTHVEVSWVTGSVPLTPVQLAGHPGMAMGPPAQTVPTTSWVQPTWVLLQKDVYPSPPLAGSENVVVLDAPDQGSGAAPDAQVPGATG